MDVKSSLEESRGDRRYVRSDTVTGSYTTMPDATHSPPTFFLDGEMLELGQLQ